MFNRSIGVVTSLLVILAAGMLVGCGDDYGDPKQTVIQMFGAMQRDDRAALTGLLDLPALMMMTDEDYSLQTDSPRLFHSPDEILDDLTGDGDTKVRWFSYQRIIGDTNLDGEVATVEVTFVDKENSRGYLTRFGLHIINGKWRIYTFKTVQEPPGSSVG